ncbi:MAG TPA: sulfatase-like hydrolase/transferase [Solirubrobacterales bacterium]|jgi:arylsulfatase A-like enzyme|nr:sulfatase-like hydrolase/transferase [Solirubrobacterales bacterium]
MSESDELRNGLTRKQLLGSGASAAAMALLAQGAGVERALAAAKGQRGDVNGMNIILILTDQERAIQHFPPNWLRQNLPGMRRLRRHGLSFERAFTNACMCSPARSTLMSGYFPAQHGVKYTLEEDMPAEKGYPQVELPTDFKNLATVMKAAGYHVVYKGKWHCSKPAEPEHATPADLEEYGFDRWNPPDAGANQSVPEAGGGFVDNDGRFMDSVGQGEHEGVLQYLSSAAAKQQPFFMVISLVNPHDVLFYPSKTFEEAGYDESWLEGDIQPPRTGEEDLSTKPTVQEEFLKIFNVTGKPENKQQVRNYLNYYGNLMRSSDSYMVNVLDKLEETGLFDDTLIVRTADHGEMGLTHGGLRQKNFNFYEEAIRVPLVYSNPKLFPKPVETDALVSHVDFLPTLASLAAAPKPARANWQGVDYSKLVLHPNTAKPAQDYIVFTYDDFQSGQKTPPYPKPPNHITSIREGRWKLAKYHDVANQKRKQKPPQWEMYDLKTDPYEETNLAYKGYERTEAQEKQFQRLKRKLARVEKTRLHPPAAKPA